jgi:hypothetical protein
MNNVEVVSILKERVDELGKNIHEPVGKVIEIEEVYGHTFKKRKQRVVQWAKEVDVGTLLYTSPVKD